MVNKDAKRIAGYFDFYAQKESMSPIIDFEPYSGTEISTARDDDRSNKDIKIKLPDNMFSSLIIPSNLYQFKPKSVVDYFFTIPYCHHLLPLNSAA